MRTCAILLVVLSFTLLSACSGGGSGGSGGANNPSPPPPPPATQAPQLGTGDHTPSSVTLTTISASGLAVSQPTDLAFSPVNAAELWIISPGSMSTMMDDSFVIIDNVLAGTLTGERIDDSNDGNFGHFAMNSSGIAFGTQTSSAGNGWVFATSQDETRAGDDFMGPTLWPADRTVIGHYPPGYDLGLGSHLDMLHSTRYGKGITHEAGNVFWTLGEAYYTVKAGTPKNCLSRYDFNTDHTPGKDYHGDGEKWHYAEGLIDTLNNVPAHLYYHAPTQMLYAADTGNSRIVRLDTNSGGTPQALTAPAQVHTGDGVEWKVPGATLTDVVPASSGYLTSPCGLEFYNNMLFVSDYATGIIHAFDLAGTRLNWIDTGLGAGAVTGLAFGPDGKLYFCDQLNDRIVRLNP
jgi:hypothetical protein